jgi:2-dehydro-3-deoxyphosphooctonate aldolase (KDO 8-P synthase)
VDFSSVNQLREHFDALFLDCTHSTQKLKPNGRMGGDGDLARKYLLTAGIFGYDGVFAETHPNPRQAISDGDSQIVLGRMKALVESADQINAAYGAMEDISPFDTEEGP